MVEWMRYLLLYTYITDMSYHSLSLKNFRSYSNHAVQLSPSVNIIVGPNGSGKTNLLEALYVLSHGSSFRVSDKDLVQHGQEWLRIEGVYEDKLRVMKYKLGGVPPKEFNLDGVKKQRLTHQQRVPLVLFEPNELRLLNGAPQRRRDYIDALGGRLWPTAARLKGQYERALLQRNNIIRQAAERPSGVFDDQFFVWDIKLSEYAAGLVERRLELIKTWNQRLSELYSSIAGAQHNIEVIYKSSIQTADYKAALLHQLTARRQQDIVRGFTSVGPHRDDLVVLINGVDASVSASRGELRTLVLAIKIIELNVLNELSDKRPLLLLDDVFSELDAVRRRALAELARDFQTIITTTDADIVADYFSSGYNLLSVAR